MASEDDDRAQPVQPAREYDVYGKPVLRLTWPMIISLFGIGGIAVLSLAGIGYGLWKIIA